MMVEGVMFCSNSPAGSRGGLMAEGVGFGLSLSPFRRPGQMLHGVCLKFK